MSNKTILALDPGPELTAFVVMSEFAIKDCGRIANDRVRSKIYDLVLDAIACEEIRCYGMPMGQTTIQTAYAIGSFQEAARHVRVKFDLLGNPDVRLHWCKSPRAKDGNVRQALFDYYGEKGTKKQPGRLYPVYDTGAVGAAAHILSALAVGGYWYAKQSSPLAI